MDTNGSTEGGTHKCRLQTFGHCFGDTSRDTVVRTVLMRHWRGDTLVLRLYENGSLQNQFIVCV